MSQSASRNPQSATDSLLPGDPAGGEESRGTAPATTARESSASAEALPPPSPPPPGPPGPPVFGRGDVLARLARARRAVLPVARRQDTGCPYPVLSHEDVLAACWPALDAEGIVTVPRLLLLDEEPATIRTRQEDVPARRVLVRIEWWFVAPDGSAVCALVGGEAVDAGDSAVAQAQTVAAKAALVQVLLVRATSGGRGRPGSGSGRSAPASSPGARAGAGGPSPRPPASGPAPAAAHAGGGPDLAEKRRLLDTALLAAAEGDVALANAYLEHLTAWKDRPGVGCVAELSDKAVGWHYARLGELYTAEALALFRDNGP